MSPFLLIGLITAACSLPFLTNDDLVDDNGEDPMDPADTPDAVNGTAGDDMLIAAAGETVNGLDGNDDISGGDGTTNATLNGGDGADTLEGFGTDIELNGDLGADVLTLETTLDPDATVTSSANGGDGDDTITATGLGGTISGGGGEDVINVQGTFDAVSGGNGEDIISTDSADFGGGSPVNGGAGNDQITSSDSAGFGITTEIDGGTGDDLLISNVLAGDADSSDILTGGAGADTFTVGFFSTGSLPTALGQITEITDFDASEDQLVIDLSGFDVFGPEVDAQNLLSFEIVELDDGSGSQVMFTVSNADATEDLTGSILLSGVTGLSGDDLVFTETAES